MATKTESEAEKNKWRTRVRSVRDDRRRRIICDAHDIGGLTNQEIADLLSLSRVRVMQIVKEVRKERADLKEQENNG